MKFSQLQYLIAIVETGSMKKAAETLHITHATLSISLSNLEKELHTHLIDRSHKGCTLSVEGQGVYAIAKRIAQKMQQLDDIKRSCAQSRQILTTSLSPTLSNMLYRIHSDFSKLYTETQLQLQEDSMLSPDMLRGSKFDFLFFTSYNNDNIPSDCYQLFTSPYVFVVSKLHPLADKNKLALSSLNEAYPLLLFEEQDTPVPLSHIPAGSECFGSLDTIRTLLSDHNCIALIPQIFASKDFYCFNQNLHSIKAIGCRLKLNGYVFHNSDKIYLPLQQIYLDFLLAQFQQSNIK